MSRLALACLCPLLLLLLGCGQRSLGERTRALGEWQVAGQSLQLEGRWSGVHIAAHAQPEFGWAKARDLYTLSWRFAGEPRLARVGFEQPRAFDDEASADAALAALRADGCVRDELLVYRVDDPGATAVPPRWRVVYVVQGALVDVEAPTQAGECETVLASAPSWASWLHEQGQGEPVCTLAREAGQLQELVRCALRGSGGAHWVRESEQVAVVTPSLTDADLARAEVVDALFQVVGPDTDLQADASTVAGFVLRSSARDKQLAWIDAIATTCSTKPCPEWQAQAAAMVARVVGDTQACARMVAAAGKLLERNEDLLALRAIAAVSGCGPAAEVAAVMRVGLQRRTGGELELRSPDQTAYEVFDNDCRDPGVMFADGSGNPLCPRFPRLAGSWLANHCDAEAVAVAKLAAAQADPELDPRTDMVFDGALRVLGKCDHAAFEAAIASAPEQSGPAAADARGKPKLRELFLRE